ncbi:hypothetical protein DF268_07680 [Streptomyces sp. V2]|nr:hypothetical protein DF268_07680 [Streptomyces sp. V2]
MRSQKRREASQVQMLISCGGTEGALEAVALTMGLAQVSADGARVPAHRYHSGQEVGQAVGAAQR